ncbi:glutamate receptor-like [Uloborus diversus]|uniref:glutamate receptor-like n=1 Tax=Uloborus diversus TaxID=327109 RepID=UPI00240A0868|nr:glutamate receptor-like [Uloborus diversus]
MKCNKNLKIAISPYSNVIEINERNSEVEVVGGYESTLLRLLLQYFAPMHVFVYPLDGEWGRRHENGSWTGLIGLLQRKEADIAVSYVGITEMRATVVDFSAPYTVTGQFFATRAPRVLPRTISVLQPFPTEAWLCNIAAVVFVSIMLLTFFGVKSSFIGILLNVCRRKPFGCSPTEIRHTSGKILYASSVFSLMILAFSYTAVLLTNLTILFRESGLHSISELRVAVQKGSYKCFIEPGILLESLEKSSDVSVKTIGQAIRRNDWFIRPPTINNFQSKIFSEKTAIIASLSTFRTFHPDSILISDDMFLLTPVSVAVVKEFPCKKELNEIISKITASGIYGKSIEDYYFRKTISYINSTDEANLSLSVTDVKELFLILGIGYILSSIVLLGEIILDQVKHCITKYNYFQKNGKTI